MKLQEKEILIERFDVFYKAYPRKVSKNQALKTWLKLKPSEELLNEMLEALKWQVGLKTWENKQFIPHPSTWLNAGKWEDEFDSNLMVQEKKKSEKEILLELMANKKRKMGIIK